MYYPRTLRQLVQQDRVDDSVALRALEAEGASLEDACAALRRAGLPEWRVRGAMRRLSAREARARRWSARHP